MVCWCIDLCGWFLRQVASSTEDKGVGYSCEDCMIVVS